MGREPSASACERARTWAALRPDGELSTIEVRLLDAHLDGCPTCRGFADIVSDATRLVREAEDEAPAHAFDPRIVRRSRTRAVAASFSRAGVAAAVVIAAFSVGVVLPDVRLGLGGDTLAAPTLTPVLTNAPDDADLMRLERADDPQSRVGATSRRFGAVL
jgi:predicted anti-sigma-YlaC factor YlaD